MGKESQNLGLWPGRGEGWKGLWVGLSIKSSSGGRLPPETAEPAAVSVPDITAACYPRLAGPWGLVICKACPPQSPPLTAPWSGPGRQSRVWELFFKGEHKLHGSPCDCPSLSDRVSAMGQVLGSGLEVQQ